MPQANVTEGVSIDDYSTWRAVRFADRDEIELREPENRLFFYAAVPQNVCRTLKGGGTAWLETRNACGAAFLYRLSFRCGVSPVNRRGSLRTREIEKDESAPPKTGEGHVTDGK